MKNAKQVSSRTFTKADIELIERIIYKNGDDIAVSISCSFERLEERLDAMEARLNSRLTDLSDEIAETTEEKLAVAV